MLVHVGFAISIVDEEEAARTYKTLQELDQLTEFDAPQVDEESAAETAMKYLDEYRNERVARNLLNEIRRIQTRPWVIMEVCGGQTHSIVRNGIDFLLPEGVELVHGPGCPVCVTPLETIDKAHAIACAARRHLLFLWRHAARARLRGRPVHAEVARGRHSRRLFAARLPEDRPRQPREKSGVLRHRL